MKIIVSVLFLLMISALCFADLVDCEYATVTDKLAGASPGETVTCPTDTVTWSAQITVPANVTLAGAGIGNTVVSGYGIKLSANSRLTGFEFANDIAMDVVEGAQGWRFDHNEFNGSYLNFKWLHEFFGDCNTGIHAGGLIDHNTMNDAGMGIDGCQDIYSDILWYGSGWQAYNDHGSGGEKVYVEDNTFTNTHGTASNCSFIDSNYSGRYVARYNTINEAHFEFHGARDSRSGQSFEIYENQINNSSRNVMAGFFRPGSGVIFNNDCAGPAIRCDWTLFTERCITNYPGTPYPYAGMCDSQGPTAWDTTPHPATGTGHL